MVKDDLKMILMKREQLEIEMNKSQLQAVVDFEQVLNDMIDAKGFAYTLGVLKNQFKLVVEHQVPKTRQTNTLLETARGLKDLLESGR